jgi:predicted glutamine amidotransferase
MGVMVAVAGRMKTDAVLSAARESARADCETPGWGMSYCYGNRLETVKSLHPCNSDHEFSKLNDVRTDMMLVCLGSPTPPLSPRELRPFVRREVGHSWAFGHYGEIRHPERMQPGGRVTDSTSPSERLFLHILNTLRTDDPVDSATKSLEALGGEAALSFCLVSCETLLVGCWHADAPESAGTLWVGYGSLARYVSSKPLQSMPEVRWETMPNRTLFAINRARRETT